MTASIGRGLCGLLFQRLGPITYATTILRFDEWVYLTISLAPSHGHVIVTSQMHHLQRHVSHLGFGTRDHLMLPVYAVSLVAVLSLYLFITYDSEAELPTSIPDTAFNCGQRDAGRQSRASHRHSGTLSGVRPNPESACQHQSRARTGVRLARTRSSAPLHFDVECQYGRSTEPTELRRALHGIAVMYRHQTIDRRCHRLMYLNHYHRTLQWYGTSLAM